MVNTSMPCWPCVEYVGNGEGLSMVGCEVHAARAAGGDAVGDRRGCRLGDVGGETDLSLHQRVLTRATTPATTAGDDGADAGRRARGATDFDRSRCTTRAAVPGAAVGSGGTTHATVVLGEGTDPTDRVVGIDGRRSIESSRARGVLRLVTAGPDRDGQVARPASPPWCRSPLLGTRHWADARRSRLLPNCRNRLTPSRSSR